MRHSKNRYLGKWIKVRLTRVGSLMFLDYSHRSWFFYYCSNKLPKIWWLIKVSVYYLFPWVRSLSTRWLRFSTYGHEVKVKVLIGVGFCLGGSLLLGLFKLLVEFCVVPGCWPGDTLRSWNKQHSAHGHGLSLCLSAFAFSSASFSDSCFSHLFCFSDSSIVYQDILG